jgi:hypothetical protein
MYNIIDRSNTGRCAAKENVHNRTDVALEGANMNTSVLGAQGTYYRANQSSIYGAKKPKRHHHMHGPLSALWISMIQNILTTNIHYLFGPQAPRKLPPSIKPCTNPSRSQGVGATLPRTLNTYSHLLRWVTRPTPGSWRTRVTRSQGRPSTRNLSRDKGLR